MLEVHSAYKHDAHEQTQIYSLRSLAARLD
jgi:hypothetical protein